MSHKITTFTGREQVGAEEFWHLTTQSLKRWARNESFKERLRRDTTLRKVLHRAASRHVAGRTRSEALQVAQELSSDGLLLTIDFAGEKERTLARIEKVKQELLQLISAINTSRLSAQISLDLSQVGLLINQDLALKNAQDLVETARSRGVEIVFNMEETALVDSTLDVCDALAARGTAVGITLQAHLRRTRRDLERMMRLPGKIRLVKGAYAESDALALSRGPALDRAFFEYARALVNARHPCAIATHDGELVDQVIGVLDGLSSTPPVEFEFLFGAGDQALSRVRASGYPARTFLTYGPDWFLYVCHRLAEHPPGLIVALEDCMRIDSQHQHYPDDDASSQTELVDPTRRRFSSVLVMNKTVQHRGILANAAFVVGLTCGSDFDEELFGTDVCDGSSSIHRRLTNIGHVVRKASPSKLRTLREMAMRNPEIRVVDYPEVAATTEYEVYRNRLEESEGTEVAYRAVHLYGPADAVHALTKNLSPLS